MSESYHALNTKVVRNIAMTALAKIQNFCIRVEKITKISVSVGLLPVGLGIINRR
jgi:hypothetical protein